jgi:hypothetical protein
MGIDRRRLLQYTSAGCVLPAVPGFASAATTLRVYAIRDAVALPLLAPGDVLLVDTAHTFFGGEGIYLYPAWGQPRPYAVRASGTLLEFRNPGSGMLLWTQSIGLDAGFAGLVVGRPEAVARQDYPVLCVAAVSA